MRSWLAGLAAAAATLIGMHAASAATVTPIYSFCSVNKCADGAQPSSPVTVGANGLLYGTTGLPGTGTEVLYRLYPVKTGYKQKIMHTFCYDVNKPNCPDGQNPVGRVVVDPHGNVYGLTFSGGVDNQGVFYTVSPKGKYKVLFKFCRNNCNGGYAPFKGVTYFGAESGLPYDGTSPLYAFTDAGSSVVRFSQNGNKWAFTALVTLPQITNLVTNTDGTSFFATTSENSLGSLYKLTPTEGQDTLTATKLYDFCTNKCKEGSIPGTFSINPATGDLWGATNLGSDNNQGAIWKSPAPDHTSVDEVYAFCPTKSCTTGYSVGSNDLDAQAPTGPTYGTSQGGGSGIGGPPWQFLGGGTIFQVASDGTYSVVYNFCPVEFCRDGYTPISGLTPDGHGHYFGVTQLGGNGQYGYNHENPFSIGGLVYEFTP
jgi:hypothetical protein